MPNKNQRFNEKMYWVRRIQTRYFGVGPAQLNIPNIPNIRDTPSKTPLSHPADHDWVATHRQAQ
jgi:hypothetical protein